MENRARGHWVVYLSLLMAFLLTAFPLPEVFNWGRPQWVAMITLYWVMMMPQRFGVAFAFIVGVILDGIEGTIIGQNAFILTLMSFFVLASYQRLRMFAVIQQVFSVSILMCLCLGLKFVIERFQGMGQMNTLYFMPALISACVWPWLYLILGTLSRRFKVA